MKTRILYGVLAVSLGAWLVLQGCGRDTGRLGSMVWPPDTIRAVYVSGNTYDVTTSPPARDPRMKVIMVWPPETTTVVYARPASGGGWVPDTTELQIHYRPLFDQTLPGEEAMAPAERMTPTVVTWPPDTTTGWVLPRSYPREILLVWPPDTT